jgi:hypothetical protein
MERRARSPLVGSVDALLAVAAGVMALSLGGMTLYAGSHLHNADAPLQPAAVTAAPAAAAKTTTTNTTGRLQLSRGITITTTLPVTRTHRS